MYQFMRIVQRDTLNLFLNPMWVFMSIALPFFLASILGFLSEGMYGSILSSYDYYGISMIFFGILNTATFSANSFLEEKIKRANLRIIYTPINKKYLTLSKVISTFIFTSFFYSLTAVFLHFIFDVNYGGENTVYVWFLLMGMNLFFSSLGVLMCCIFKSEEIANQILSIVTTLFALFSGFFFPIQPLGKLFVKISNSLPTTKILNDIWTIIFDQNHTTFLLDFLLIIGLSLLMIKGATYCFNEEDFL